MDEGRDAKQVAIKDQAEELQEILYGLVAQIDNLVERNPKPATATVGPQDQADNVFDEIASTLRHCRGLVREATEKVQAGIASKVL